MSIYEYFAKHAIYLLKRVVTYFGTVLTYAWIGVI